MSNISSVSETESSGTKTWPLWLNVSFIILALAKLWLVREQTLSAYGTSMHDDRLFLNHAYTLLEGKWLGIFNHVTLVKGPFYPLWIAFAFLSGIPLMLSQHLLYIGACVLLVAAISPFVKRPVTLLIIYAVLLFNPMSYTDQVMSRAIREGIYPAFTILTFGGAIGMLARRESSFKKLLSWSLMAGLALSASWLTREEGVWIIPSILAIFISAAVMIWQGKPKYMVRRLLPYALPFCILLISIAGVSLINGINYGFFNTVEFKSSDFRSAYGALTRVEHAHWNPVIPVPRETRERIYKASKTFAELRPYLEGKTGELWTAESCGPLAICDDIGGGWFVWAFRDAVAAAGYYKSWESAAGFYRDLTAEVNSACKEGKLECGPKRSTMTPPWHSEYLRPLIDSFFSASIYLGRFKGFNAISSPSVGTDEQLVLFRDMTSDRLSPRPEDHFITLKGWAFSPEYPLNLSVDTAKGEPAKFAATYEDSQDVYDSFLKEGKDFPNAMKSRFEIRTLCMDCYLHIKKGGISIETLKIMKNKSFSRETPQLYFDIKMVDYNTLPEHSRLNELKIKYLTMIAKTYQVGMPALVILTLISYVIRTIRILIKRDITAFYIINTSLILAVIIRLGILSMINISSFPAISTIYLSPAYPLLLMFVAFSFVDCKTLLKGKTR